MRTQFKSGYQSLTEKEKQTLRLIVRGHDAKSIARNLGLSVHTINERLRDARRKMAVSSSRQAARFLLEAEGDGGLSTLPDFSRDNRIGEDAVGFGGDQSTAPINGAGRVNRPPWIGIGVLVMTLVLGLLILTTWAPVASTPPAAEAVQSAPTPDSQVVDTARQWLALLDAGRWDESYRLTGTAFQKLNTLEVWTSASEHARVPLGAMVSRTLIGQENLPAPPFGYEVVKFRTRFVGKADTVETVTLERENGSWRIVGVTIG